MTQTILRYLRGAVFEPHDIEAMSTALEDVCAILKIPTDAAEARRPIAARIIELTQQGEHSTSVLRERLLAEKRAS